jgi:SsrA-binding protein
MAGKKSKAKSRTKDDDFQSQIICRNRRARRDYDILDTLECGISLKGSEVKSIRDRKVTIEEAFARLENGEVWLLGANVAEYPQANVMNHEPKRPRKLLLKRRQIMKFAESAGQQGLTLVPLEMHFSTRGMVKVTLAVAKGRRQYDKRERLKKETHKREMREAARRG